MRSDATINTVIHLQVVMNSLLFNPLVYQGPGRVVNENKTHMTSTNERKAKYLARPVGSVRALKVTLAAQFEIKTDVCHAPS